MKKKLMKMAAFCTAVALVAACFNTAVIPAKAKSTVKISKTSVTALRYHKFKLKITGTSKSVKWSSSNKVVATVDKKGQVTAENTGSAKIKAKVGGKTYTCKVKVVEYDKDEVIAAYAYKAIPKALAAASNVKMKKIWAGTYVTNNYYACIECTYTDLFGDDRHVYGHVYAVDSESLSYQTAFVDYYTGFLEIKFYEQSPDLITLNRSREIPMDTAKKISKEIFNLETIKVEKGENFSAVNSSFGF